MPHSPKVTHFRYLKNAKANFVSFMHDTCSSHLTFYISYFYHRINMWW